MTTGCMLRLDADSLLAEARRRTGLSNFGDESFLVPLRMLVRAMEDEAALHAAGRAAQSERLVVLLVNRLLAEELIRRHPEILQENIQRPFAIVGLPRTGTTMLQRMIATDPRVLALRWWESVHPAPLPGEGDSGTHLRIAAAEQEVAGMLATVPEILTAHPIDAHAPDEELMLLEHSFFSTNSEAYVNVPTFSAWLDAQDQTAGYEYLKRMLQLIQWQKRQRGETGERWVLKSPHHLGFMDLLFTVFPDLQIIQTHRDPIATVPSFASLVHMIRRLGSDRSDPKEVGRQWGQRQHRAIHRAMAVRQSHEERFLDIRYETLLADRMAQIRRIYQFVGLELTPAVEERMRQWANENAREKRASHRYALEEFGFSEAGIRRDFAAYYQRFLRDH
jgi:Sulfotransferase family